MPSRNPDYVHTKRVINFTLQLQSFLWCIIKYEHEWPYIKLIKAKSHRFLKTTDWHVY
jgi:hypothetical protein